MFVFSFYLVFDILFWIVFQKPEQFQKAVQSEIKDDSNFEFYKCILGKDKRYHH